MTDTGLTALTLRLAQLSRELDAAQRDLAQAEIDVVRSKHRADLAEAKAFVDTDGSVEIRKRKAFLDSEQHRLDAEVADAGVKAARSRMATLRSQVEIGRTLVSSARAEMQNFSGAA